MKRNTRDTALLLATAALATAQSSCSSTLSASYPAPSVAEGYVARLVAQDLTSPRGIKFDSDGALLVVEEGVGVSALTPMGEDGDCMTLGNRKLVVDEPSLNHGIEMSEDGKILYASSGETLYVWSSCLVQSVLN